MEIDTLVLPPIVLGYFVFVFWTFRGNGTTTPVRNTKRWRELRADRNHEETRETEEDAAVRTRRIGFPQRRMIGG